jgi:hypothetical protein
MHSDNIENMMLRGAQDELERRHANAEREGVAHALLVDEFEAACVDGMNTKISYGYGESPLVTVLRDLLDDPEIVRYLANKYAAFEVQRYVEQGGLHD